MNLKDKLYNYKGLCLEPFEFVEQRNNIKKDVKEAIKDYKLYVSIHNWRFDNIGKKDSDYITQRIEYLEKKYGCKYFELGFDEIFGNFEK